MKNLDTIMSKQSKKEYLASCRLRYAGRGAAGRTALISEVVDALGWSRKHAIKALNGRVSTGGSGGRGGSKPSYGAAESAVVVGIWRLSEQPCGVRLKETLPLWLDSYEAHYGLLGGELRSRVLGYSARTLERITAAHRVGGAGVRVRRSGRSSNRIKRLVPVRCGPQETDAPGWMETDTVAHGGGGAGTYLWSLTLTDLHSGWTELAALWGDSGGEVRAGLERIEQRLPFELLGFDCDNGSEFLNAVLAVYLLDRPRKVDWTRSRPYRKNDQAHVEQKNFTHVRQLLGYGRFGDLALKDMVEALYVNTWLPLRNHFTPVMKLVEKRRIGAKVRRKYDRAAAPCDRLLACAKVDESIKARLRAKHAGLDPVALAAALEEQLERIFQMVDWIEEERLGERIRAGEVCGQAGAGCAAVRGAPAPRPSASPAPARPRAAALEPVSATPNQPDRRVS